MASRAAAAVEPVETPATGRGLSRATFSAFRSRPFALLWANTFLFALSQAFQQFTLAWLALKISEDGETVFGLTLGAGTAVGLVLFALGLPVLAFGLYAGALADRIDRRLLLFGSQLAGIGVTAAAAALMAAGLIGIWSTFALALLLGATLAFGQPVRMAILPSLVTPARVLNAVTLTNLGLTSSQMLGQPISGLLINLGGIETAFAAQSALLTLGLAPLLGLRVPRVAAEGARRLREELREGLSFVAGHAGIRALMFVLLATALVMAGTFMALLPRIAREELGAGAFAASLLFGAMGPGTLMASLLLASVPRLRRAGLFFLATLVAGGVLNVALGLAPWYWFALLVMFATGWNAGFFTNLNMALVQAHTPNVLMGRVMSIYTMCMVGGMPLGALASGAISDVVGSREWFAICGAALFALGLAAMLTQPALRRMASAPDA